MGLKREVVPIEEDVKIRLNKKEPTLYLFGLIRCKKGGKNVS